MKKGSVLQGYLCQGLLVGVLLAASVAQTGAQFTLSAGNASVQINVGGSNPGLSAWMVGGVNELEQQWFYYSVGSGPVNSIDTISPWSTISQSATALSGAYFNSTLSVSNSYSLQNLYQNSTSLSALTTTISIQNVSGSTQSFNFYQYSQFGLGGVSGGQNVEFTGTAFPYTVYQYNPNNPGDGYLEGTIATGLGTTVTEVAGIYNGTDFGLGENVTAPNFTSTVLGAGTGSVNFGYEFTATLAPLSSITVSEIQTVPEPSAMGLISLGIAALSLLRWRKLVSNNNH